MKKFIYLFTLFAICIGLTVVQAASPTYDDEPPSYIWGSGGLNAQTSGTPNKSGEDRIVDAVNAQGASITAAIANQSTNVGSISVDTSAIESYLRVGDGQIATTTVTDLINGIGTDTSNIESYLKYNDGTNDYTQSELTHDIKTQVASISSNIAGLLGDSITGYRSQRLSIAPETPTVLTPIVGSVGSSRAFIELRALDETAVFYIGFGNGVTDSNGRPTKGRILINVPTSNQNITIYHTNESNLDIQQTEGWK